jgi:hypothetical protein
MKLLVVVLSLFLILASCGRENDYFVPCNDGSGSQKCRKLYQNELAKYIKEDRESFYWRWEVPSGEPSGDKNTIQTFIINMRYVNPIGSQIHYSTTLDERLSCNFESYYGVLDESSSRANYSLKIYGIYYPQARYRCPFPEVISGDRDTSGESLIYMD